MWCIRGSVGVKINRENIYMNVYLYNMNVKNSHFCLLQRNGTNFDADTADEEEWKTYQAEVSVLAT